MSEKLKIKTKLKESKEVKKKELKVRPLKGGQQEPCVGGAFS
jgi:hypothetical protein